MSDQIAIIWTVDDVLSVADWLTREQAAEVLQDLSRRHDASIGINWTVIETTASIMFPKPSDPS